jgi:hypothetical protein
MFDGQCCNRSWPLIVFHQLAILQLKGQLCHSMTQDNDLQALYGQIGARCGTSLLNKFS